MIPSPHNSDDVNDEFEDIRVLLAPQVDLTANNDGHVSYKEPTVIKIPSDSESDSWSGYSSPQRANDELNDSNDNSDNSTNGDTSDDKTIPNPP